MWDYELIDAITGSVTDSLDVLQIVYKGDLVDKNVQ